MIFGLWASHPAGRITARWIVCTFYCYFDILGKKKEGRKRDRGWMYWFFCYAVGSVHFYVRVKTIPFLRCVWIQNVFCQWILFLDGMWMRIDFRETFFLRLFWYLGRKMEGLNSECLYLTVNMEWFWNHPSVLNGKL